jgi:hypothetical protein
MRALRAIHPVKATIVFSGLVLAGCAESSFVLAPESRLPAWFEVPPGEVRAEVAVKLDYYVRSSGPEATFALVDSRGHELGAKQGTVQGRRPLTLRSSVAGYPSYEIVTVDGITEVLEHRRMEPVFYVTDDAAILKELGVSQRRSTK